MDISLVNAGLAAGAGLASLPVILHLFMRQKPKHVVFPALRLIKERQKRSRKKLKVKNWLLLLARMALLALMALALARPTITTEASIGGDQEVPTAIGLVFDTSLSMEYKQNDKSRLKEAQERALEILGKTPSTSQVFVSDTADPNVLEFSPTQAMKWVEGRTLRDINRPLNVAVGQVYAAIAGVDKPRHEVYVLTDLARSAWDMERQVDALDKIKKVKNGVKTYVLRLAPKDVTNVAVVEAKPANDAVTEGVPVEIVARLRSLGPATSRIVELWLDDVPKDKKQVELTANGEAEVRFEVPVKSDSGKSIHQGYIKLNGRPDPLEFDDKRHFTFNVKPAVNVLIVSDDPEDALFIGDAIDPSQGARTQGLPRPFRADRFSAREFSEKSNNLSKRYRCIFVNNVASFSDLEWGRLAGFVQEGGGLVIGLGNRSKKESYVSATAGRILPATLVQAARPKDGTSFGQVTDYSHPLFSKYSKELTALLGQVPVSRYWETKVPDNARVLLSYADKSPALIERVFKGARTGRVLLWTTPLARRAELKSPEAWNEFPMVGWSFWWLMNQTVAYVAGTSETGLNFEAGKDVLLPIDPTLRYTNFIVRDPEKKTNERLIPPASSDTLIVAAHQRGNWTIQATGTEGKEETLGFSVNAPVSESQFVPLETADLNKLFAGEENYVLADDPKRLVDVVKNVRIGTELFPWMMILIMIVVTLEGILANRFYRETGPRPALAEAA